MLDLKLDVTLFLNAFDPAILLALKLAALAICGDAVITWILAATQGQFDIRQVPRFLQTNAFPYLSVLLVLACLTVADPDYKPVFYFICAVVTAKFGVEALKDKLTQFFKPTQLPPADSGDKAVVN